MNTKTMIVLGVAVVAGVYMMRKAKGQTSTTHANGYTTNVDGTTVDPQGNYWYGGQMIYKAPAQEWTT